MTDYTSISVPQGVKSRMEGDKPEDMGWGEYLSTLHSDQEIVIEGNSTDNVELGNGYEEIAEKIGESMDGGNCSINEAALAEALADYLINGENLPQRVADELGGGRR
jgi:hypothetical protein